MPADTAGRPQRFIDPGAAGQGVDTGAAHLAGNVDHHARRRCRRRRGRRDDRRDGNAGGRRTGSRRRQRRRPGGVGVPVDAPLVVGAADRRSPDASIGIALGRPAASHHPVAATTTTTASPSAVRPRRPGSHRSRARHPAAVPARAGRVFACRAPTRPRSLSPASPSPSAPAARRCRGADEGLHPRRHPGSFAAPRPSRSTHPGDARQPWARQVAGPLSCGRAEPAVDGRRDSVRGSALAPDQHRADRARAEVRAEHRPQFGHVQLADRRAARPAAGRRPSRPAPRRPGGERRRRPARRRRRPRSATPAVPVRASGVRTFSSATIWPSTICSSGLTDNEVASSAAAVPIRPPRRRYSSVST